MMALRIGILLLCFNTGIAYLVSTGVYDFSTDTQTHSYTEINNSMPSLDYSSQTIGQYVFGDFLHTLSAFITIVGYSTLLLPVMLSKFNLPSLFVVLFTLLTWAFYGLAIVQFLANRSERLYR